MGCRTTYGSDPLTFVAQAGTTYYFQVQANTIEQITFRLDEAPDPIAYFSYYPSDPSAYDTLQFSSYATDPAGVGISSYLWDFGDGTTSTQQYASHRYAADGDYTVVLTVRTTDGRSDTATEPVRVRTHDVSIDRLNAPATARVGQTISINVYVKNTRYPDNVRVTLDKGGPDGFVNIGSSTQLVSVSTTGKTTRFSFNYTVTNDDAAVGKITFRATATLTDNRDALPSDNQLLSTPVRIG